jgi:hypothetical protein
MKPLSEVYPRCDVFLHLDEEEGSTLVAANEAGREAFDELFNEAVIWDTGPYSEALALPDDWQATAVSIADLKKGGHRLGPIADMDKTTLGHDDVLSLAYELARECHVILFQDGQFQVIRITEAVLH